jgi:hypothetical protein
VSFIILFLSLLFLIGYDSETLANDDLPDDLQQRVKKVEQDALRRTVLNADECLPPLDDVPDHQTHSMSQNLDVQRLVAERRLHEPAYAKEATRRNRGGISMRYAADHSTVAQREQSKWEVIHEMQQILNDLCSGTPTAQGLARIVRWTGSARHATTKGNSANAALSAGVHAQGVRTAHGP